MSKQSTEQYESVAHRLNDIHDVFTNTGEHLGFTITTPNSETISPTQHYKAKYDNVEFFVTIDDDYITAQTIDNTKPITASARYSLPPVIEDSFMFDYFDALKYIYRAVNNPIYAEALQDITITKSFH